MMMMNDDRYKCSCRSVFGENKPYVPRECKLTDMCVIIEQLSSRSGIK